jgi:hypothetical protein
MRGGVGERPEPFITKFGPSIRLASARWGTASACVLSQKLAILGWDFNGRGFPIGDGERGPLQSDAARTSGNSASSETGASSPPPSGAAVIPPGHNPIRETLLPIFLVVFCALIVGLIARWNLFNRNDYIMLILAYSLLFGAGGIVLGGALRVQGQFKPFGIPWTVDAAGGIAAAVIAGLLAYSMKPACSFDSKIQITGIPLHEPDSNGPVKTFVTVETDPNVIIQRGANRGTLNFNFEDGETFSIIMRAYRQEGQQYRFLAALRSAIYSQGRGARSAEGRGDLLAQGRFALVAQF